jgi:hypothetical protein
VAEVGRYAPASCGDSGRQHRDEIVEIPPWQTAVGMGPRDDLEQRRLVPVLGGAHGHDLLREHVQRCVGDEQAIEFPGPDGEDECRALDQFVARRRELAALGTAPRQ